MRVLPIEVLRIPERAGAEDYVLRPTDSVERDAVARTVDEYVVTPALADAFDTALVLVAEAIVSGVSRRSLPDRLLRLRQEPLHGRAERVAAAL